MLLGMDIIRMLGGVRIDQSGNVFFSRTGSHACAMIRIEELDFSTEFNEKTKAWTMSWKWSGNQPPNSLVNKVPDYPVSVQVQQEYRHEQETWLNNGWLLPYPEEELGPLKALIPLMAVVQQNKSKLRTVLDFCQLNGYVDAYTMHANVWVQKLTDWRKKGSNVSMLNLWRAYLQVHVHKSLWSYQTVIFEGKRYCLLRMGFGLNVAPSIIWAIVEAALLKDNVVWQATSAYIDVFIKEDIVSATRVKQHLANFGLKNKEPERLQNGARVLGLTVREKDKMQIWLRVAASFIKRRATDVTRGWDDEVTDILLTTMITEVVARVHQKDPVWGKWCVDGPELNVWIDASSLATGVSLEHDGAVIEDASWLRKERDIQHVNLVELYAVLKGINMAQMWEATILHIHTDSACMYKWVTVCTRAASEMLIRHRLDALASLVKEYGLSVDVVRSEHNRADSLTRVPQQWFDLIKKSVEPPYSANAVSPSEHDSKWIRPIHHWSGHPGMRQTLYFIKQVDPTVSKASMRAIVRNCKKCQSIDPPPMRWVKGKLVSSGNWFNPIPR